VWLCVCVSFILCGWFANMWTCIYCVLYCLYCFYCYLYVYLFLFVLSVLVWRLLLPSDNSTAVSNHDDHDHDDDNNSNDRAMPDDLINWCSYALPRNLVMCLSLPHALTILVCKWDRAYFLLANWVVLWNKFSYKYEISVRLKWGSNQSPKLTANKTSDSRSYKY
jgi:hypothetical protein